MNETIGFLFAYCLDGKGGGESIDLEGVKNWTPDKGALWVHLDYSVPAAISWLKHESGIDPLMQDALLAGETRPRCLVFKDAMLVILRGVNLNQGADPEDMVYPVLAQGKPHYYDEAPQNHGC